MKFPRASGILLHPTSLPSAYGVGDLGAEAYKFVDFLHDTKQAYWQILPLGPTGYGDSPYQCFSAFAGNTNLISPELLVEDGLLYPKEINEKPAFPIGRVDFGLLYEWKNHILALAFERFRRNADLQAEFEAFSIAESFWLDDYALFRAIKKFQDQKMWLEWDEPLRLRDPKALKKAEEELYIEIQAQKFQQWLFFRQWFSLKRYCESKNIRIVGDIPIFVALDSADVWCNPDQFKLNADRTPKVVAGVPPDYYSATGQLWGNPIYNWEEMQKDGFSWWISRVRATLRLVDIVRIDHFRGFAATWEVPGGDKTAINGQWVKAPGKELFTRLKEVFGELPFWAEDLGFITPDVEELRDSFGFPGMRILQFAFSGDAKNRDLPHNYIRNCVAYTGTHDNDTTVGWFLSKPGEGSTRAQEQIRKEREFCLKYLNSDGKQIHWDFIRAVWASVADTAIVPMQDVLGLGTEARMNLPASTSGNWTWQCKQGDFSEEISQRLGELTEIYGRANFLET
jgi:4-alpha-glucanotransferase